MTEHPILFNDEMVRAILAGNKTQTRRIANRPVKHPDLGNLCDPGALVLEHEPQHVIDRACPYGQPGDRLWVRENWWQAGEFVRTYPEDDEGAWSGSRRVFYSADGTPPNEPNRHYPNGLSNGSRSAAAPDRIWRSRPSIHMPRWACRILLEIVSVRIERVQDVTLGDICKEIGAASIYEFRPATYGFDVFAELWDEIYGQGSWNANPWVWVVEFKRVSEAA